MNELFSQGGKGSTGILTNKQAIARKFNVKQSEIVYFSVGVDLGGYKVIYDKATQRSYSLPTLASGVTGVSLSTAGVLVHSSGSADLGELGVLRDELIVASGSFAEGGQVQTKNQVLHDETGIYRWEGALPKDVPEGSTVLSAGGIGDGLWKAASIAGFMQEISNVIYYARPEEFGGVGDGITDDTAAIQAAIASSKMVSLAGKKWKISSTIDLPDGYSLDLRASNIVAATGSTPLFTFNGMNSGLNIVGGGGVITGTASAFLECTGASDTPANADYVKQIRIYGVHVSSPTITYAIRFVKAVRQIFIDSCMFYTVNGIVSSGKTVELACTKTIVFGSTAGTDTVGIGIYSTGTGGPYYNEGWHFTDCTIDNFERTFDVTDIFVLTVYGGFIGNNSNTGYAFYFAEGVTSHTREISIRSVIGGRVRFANSSAGKLYHASISGEITYCKGGSGTALSIGDNCTGIDIRGMKFTTNTGHILASVGNNSANVHFSDISSDSSLISGIIFNGDEGGNCSISNFVYAGSGEALSLARAVRLSNVPCTGVNTPMWSTRVGYIATSGDVTVGNYIASTPFTAAKDSKLLLNINMVVSGVAASNAQSIGITVPAGVLLPNGAQSMIVTLPGAAINSMSIVCTVTTNFKNLLFSVDNRAGSTLRVLAGTHLSVTLIN